MKIDSADFKIDDLLKGRTFFIPRFQRAYSWEADQVSQFWSDIIDARGDAYFIGSMVVYPVDRSKFAVVDGQQRLTTITILLCALRDAFTTMGETDLAAGLQVYIEQKDRNNKIVYVLETETSFPYLQEEILKRDRPDIDIQPGHEEGALKRAYDLFLENINHNLSAIDVNKERTTEENRLESVKWLLSIRDTVFDLSVILVELDNEDDAYLIFETLNTRGKDLALADLLRNHFAKFLKPKSSVDVSKIKWSGVLDTIEESSVKLDPDTFIVHSWQSRYDFVTKAKTFPKVKSRITKDNASNHLDRFVSDVGHWRSIFDTDFNWTKSEKEAKRSLEALRIFKVVQPTPGILSLVRAYRDGHLKYKTLRDTLSTIEKFHFAFNAVTQSRSSGGISGMYSSFGRQLFTGSTHDDFHAAISDLKQKLRDRVPAVSEFDSGFQQLVYTKTNNSQKSLIQYILKKVAVAEGQPTVGHSDDLTIEHLLPQSSLKSGSDPSLVGQVGNLILVDSVTNTKLANNKFSQKKQILLANGYKLPQLLLDADDLNEDLVIQNTLRVAEVSRTNIWSI